MAEETTETCVRESEVSTETYVKEILNWKLGEVSSALEVATPSMFIFRAPRELRRVNEGAFEPQTISIGPYHHGKEHLKAMEIHKVCYLSNLLYEGGVPLERFIAAYMETEQQVRNCYAEQVGRLSSAEFGAIMVLDGLFVVQLIRKFVDRHHQEKHLRSKGRGSKEGNDLSVRVEDDDLFKQNLNLSLVAQDLLLLENQLPFYVLEMFACMIGLDVQTFTRQALNFFSDMEPRLRMLYIEEDNEHIQSAEHLLGLVHHNWIQFPTKERISNVQALVLELIHPFEEIRKHLVGKETESRRIRRLGEGEWDFTSAATELSERGIGFRQGEKNCLFDIRFKNGTLFIPTLIVDHNTERIIRNLIAYEQFKGDDTRIVTDYARFIDCLVNYAADVALLCDCGVIKNRLGSNEDVANMINKLNDYVYLSNNFSYSHIFDEVKVHCRRPWNLFKVKLRQTYFNTPWDWVLTSIAAASLLLLLSLLQTIFSVLAYFKQGAS